MYFDSCLLVKVSVLRNSRDIKLSFKLESFFWISSHLVFRMVTRIIELKCDTTKHDLMLQDIYYYIDILSN